jgi:serine/threonine protein kinase
MEAKNFKGNESQAGARLIVDEQIVVADDLSEGSLVGEYQLLGFVRSGSSGDIFKATRPGLDKIFAIKVIEPELLPNALALERYEREVNAVRELTHEHLASFYDEGETSSGARYLVMGFVEGNTLRQVIESEGSLSESRVLDLSLQLCEAFTYLSQKGVMLRNLDLSDIVLSKNNAHAEVVKIVDLGIAKIFESTAYDGIDVRLLGSLMFELLTGKPPSLTSDSPEPGRGVESESGVESKCEVELGIGVAPRPRVESVKAPNIVLNGSDPAFKEGLRVVIARALQQSDLNNYRTVPQLHQDLERLANAESLPIPESKPKRRTLNALIGLSSIIAFVAALIIAPLFMRHIFLNTETVGNLAQTSGVVPKLSPVGAQQIKDNYGRVLYATDASPQSAAVSEAVQKGVSLAGADLDGVKISRETITGAKLEGAQFTSCTIDGSTFTDANLDGVTFTKCTITNTKFKNCDMVATKFYNCNFEAVSFSDAKLNDAVFQNCDAGSILNNGKIRGIIFRSSKLNGIQLLGGKWSNCKFFSVMPNAVATFQLERSTISSTNLEHADFSGASIRSSKIVAPNTSSAKFKNLQDTTVVQEMPK